MTRIGRCRRTRSCARFLDEWLAAIALALRNQRLERDQKNGWLFAGRHSGTHITADGLAHRLKGHGITHSTQARHGALLAPAARLPAPILAERLGIDRSRAAGWVRIAGAPYGECVALRAENQAIYIRPPRRRGALRARRTIAHSGTTDAAGICFPLPYGLLLRR